MKGWLENLILTLRIMGCLLTLASLSAQDGSAYYYCAPNADDPHVSCPAVCSSHGGWDGNYNSNDNCAGFNNAYGTECSCKLCPDRSRSCFGTNNCCTADQVCSTQAQCVNNCGPGETKCGWHCCPNGQICKEGVCSSCPSGGAACGNVCCPEGQTCINGTCCRQLPDQLGQPIWCALSVCCPSNSQCTPQAIRSAVTYGGAYCCTGKYSGQGSCYVSPGTSCVKLGAKQEKQSESEKPSLTQPQQSPVEKKPLIEPKEQPAQQRLPAVQPEGKPVERRPSVAQPQKPAEKKPELAPKPK